MNARVHFFKPTGKWYDSEVVQFPDGACFPWDGRQIIEAHLKGRFKGMTAVVVEGAPWGYPQSWPNLHGES